MLEEILILPSCCSERLSILTMMEPSFEAVVEPPVLLLCVCVCVCGRERDRQREREREGERDPGHPATS